MAATPLMADTTNPAAASASLGCLKEMGEDRVALSPDAVKAFVGDGYKVFVEPGCGVKAFFTDASYKEAGANLVGRSEVISKSDIVFTINPPEAEFSKFKGKFLVGWVGRLTPDGKEIVKKATAAGVSLVDVTAVPRITIAQKLDVLSSQAKVAGIRAVIEAAHAFKRFQQAEITAAGKYKPSQTFVLGCGVAGLAAMGQAKALGSVVRAWDVRDVSDQAASLGAGWVRVDFKESGEGVGGYAKQSSAEFEAAQKATFHKVCQEVDIIITTAAIPGRPSPRLIEDYMVKDMKPGSVIVDLAALGGGNCAITKKDEVYVTDNGVTIIGYTGLPSKMPGQASAMYAQNMVNLVRHIAKKDSTALIPTINKELSTDSGDIIVRSIVCCKDGQEKVMPTPPAPTSTKPKEVKEEKKVEPKDPKKVEMGYVVIFSCLLGLLAFMGLGVKTSLLGTFVLAGAAGYQVVWGVVPALHTPLMSVTNAISGLTAVGGLILLNKSGSPQPLALAVASVAVSSVNIFGGFIVSKRLLNLFKRPGDLDYSNFWLVPGVLFILIVACYKTEIKPVETLCGLMCIVAIGGLASMKTSRQGCTIGISAVATAVFATVLESSGIATVVSLICICIGAGLGCYVGLLVDPFKLPQTVAGFHSLVGLAAMVTSIGNFAQSMELGASMENIFGLLGTFIGGITLTGSIIAFLKLDARMSSTAWDLPGKNYINIASLATFIILGCFFIKTSTPDVALLILWVVAALACWMGVHLVASVGGGDMPVCITVLNSYSGWALVAEGFMLDSALLTIVGSLIGFSGGILTHIMCVAMNRDIANVLFGGMNTTVAIKIKGDEEEPAVHKEIKAEGVADMLADAKKVMIIPGYGMAVARAQTMVATIAKTCIESGVECRFGIHPVAGRMPGQMNVLLAEAGVPYDWVFELDEVNDDMGDIDVCLVVGANDITNIAANDVEGCPIYGMPVFSVWSCKNTIFFKRSMRAGYADLPNPCFYKENAWMCLGNADTTCGEIASVLKGKMSESR